MIYDALSEHMSRSDDDVLVHGDCTKGADAIADEYWAQDWGLTAERYPADWDTHGKVAGFLRNQQMVDTSPDICLAFIRNGSKGATDCVKRARFAGIPVVVYARFDE